MSGIAIVGAGMAGAAAASALMAGATKRAEAPTCLGSSSAPCVPSCWILEAGAMASCAPFTVNETEGERGWSSKFPPPGATGRCGRHMWPATDATDGRGEFEMNAVEEIRQYVRSRGLEACCLDFPGSIELAIDEEELELIRSGHGEFWDEEKVTEVLGCRPGSFRGGMFHAGGGKVSPLVLRDALLQDAIDRGARLLSSCVVERIEEKDDRVVLHTCMKTIEVEKVIVCSNAWIPQILSEYESIIRPTCDVVLMTRPLPPAWKFGFTAGDDQWYGMQMQDGRIFLGGASRECECLSLESERNVNEDASRQLRDFMSKFPFLSESDIEAEWTGPPDLPQP
ncbi:hypothetical protein GUITHDRAFT_132340 [Guillardia theta CCMP2712]|uniref:FAD dependent oxidoreductase domain-containing protein n=1 Tax=Guillardia theta (strain CCMP2712) TaxID=905079 RepID=L1K1D1_GUITC|nr:hypothetical protein GUITHDRAFT_132340 [Guillardia theta CCMP2712]EKX54656.1 hypothetical protein GUITHDRAFT_132340 [Guillardia theta CCMP2712]|eukprot:XP_005841636.1 hypothetical protein GUITHDRAFT_132340 [Guillardia theta CCMP2712]